MRSFGSNTNGHFLYHVFCFYILDLRGLVLQISYKVVYSTTVSMFISECRSSVLILLTPTEVDARAGVVVSEHVGTLLG